jgi:hypothetical protein
MKCEYCNMENSFDREVCIRCNRPLYSDNSTIRSNSDQGENRKNSSVKKTIVGRGGRASQADQPVEYSQKQSYESIKGNTIKCPFCEYPNAPGMTICVRCKIPLVKDESQKDTSQNDSLPKINLPTGDPYNRTNKTKFSLKPLKGSKEKEIAQIEFTPDKNTITLNRANTDPENDNISRTTQAIINYENGKWIITDKSRLKNTFIWVKDPFELKNGDVVLLGDQKFEVNF